jgi:hypothetical protein
VVVSRSKTRNSKAIAERALGSEVAAELRRIAEEYRKKAADLEWENWPAVGEENVGKVLQEA